ncbi:Ribonuclease T2-like protein [Pseudocohnilembus persalinus]|uniref:Ribonuclease T2-like protein n=1 Tax=Pseudocohnilembus persalinus TaxID=266149 RepID=A0A0V0QPW8_PSEPJ|nr:Ribonuclease T2-like protein [Pseudocohnilembus persalinus]|eukprot:KRX04367.1 Ribonuclease T2-like protein [Pseudocohnilembus persalinus]
MRNNILNTIFILSCIILVQCNVDYSYYVFEREWGNTVCKSRSCNKKDSLEYTGKDFNVHGLFANGKQDKQCWYWVNCEDYTYVESEIDMEILDWMNKYYVGLYNDSVEFRTHEYEKHGSCYNYDKSITTNAQRENFFFGKIKDLANQYDIVKAMNDYGIYPDDTKKYSEQDLQNALSVGFNNKGITFSFQCDQIDGDYYLNVVDICFDLDYNLMTCPCAANNCDQPFYIPSYLPFSSSSNNLRKETQE